MTDVDILDMKCNFKCPQRSQNSFIRHHPAFYLYGNLSFDLINHFIFITYRLATLNSIINAHTDVHFYISRFDMAIKQCF